MILLESFLLFMRLAWNECDSTCFTWYTADRNSTFGVRRSAFSVRQISPAVPRFGGYLLRFHLVYDWSRNNKHSRNFVWCSRFYGKDCNPKVLHRFQVRVCEEIFAKRGFGPFGVIRDFCWPYRWKYPYKVISLTIQTNINFYMFRAQVLAKKKIFDEPWVFICSKLSWQRQQTSMWQKSLHPMWQAVVIDAFFAF